MNRSVSLPVVRLGLEVPGREALERAIALETPVAFEYDGIAHAVMMATPADLEDLAVGFTLSEGLAPSRQAIADIAIAEVEGGWIARLSLDVQCAAPVMERVRMRVTEGSCGLCGLESIDQVLRPLPPLSSRISVTAGAIARALDELGHHQPDGRATGGLHAAAFCSPEGAIVLAREDVGRHNAMDKLVGAMARAELDPALGFMLLSARCSYELVEKAVRANCPMLVTISAPTSLAVERARAAGLTLVALARPDSILLCNDPHDSIRA